MSARLPPDVSRQLDAMRGLSAITVLLAHAVGLMVVPRLTWLDAPLGIASQAAVMVFFVLSGFLITASILKDAASGSFSVRRYAADRFNRIVPPLAFSMLLVLALGLIAPLVFPTGTNQFGADYPYSSQGGFVLSAQELIGACFFLNGFLTKAVTVNAPLWSLPFEVWYYVAAGLIAALGNRRGGVSAVLVLLVLGALNHRFLLFSVVWFAGAAVAVARAKGISNTRASRAVGALALTGAVIFGVLYVRSGLASSSPEQINARLVFLYNFFVGIAFAAALHEVVQGKMRLPTLGHKSSKFSYTLYIVHYPILLLVWGVLGARLYENLVLSWAIASVCVIACLLFSWFAASWVENWRPIKRRTPIAVAVAE